MNLSQAHTRKHDSFEWFWEFFFFSFFSLFFFSFLPLLWHYAKDNFVEYYRCWVDGINICAIYKHIIEFEFRSDSFDWCKMQATQISPNISLSQTEFSIRILLFCEYIFCSMSTTNRYSMSSKTMQFSIHKRLNDVFIALAIFLFDSVARSFSFDLVDLSTNVDCRQAHFLHFSFRRSRFLSLGFLERAADCVWVSIKSCVQS